MMLSGVYVISCLRNSYRYFGSSGRDIENRWSHHVALLNKGSHSCGKMQQDWARWGPEAFSFRILRLCSGPAALLIEQQYIDLGGRLYNRDKAEGGGWKHSEKSKKVLSSKAKTRNTRPEYNDMIKARAKAQHAAGNLGQATWTEDTRRAVAEKALLNSSKIGELMKQMWQDPAARSKISAARWTPERRAEQAERIRLFNLTRRKAS